MNARWLRLDQYSRRSAEQKNAKGIRIELGLSPLDVPEAVRGFRSEDGIFHIQFRYPDAEEVSSKRLSDLLAIDFGKASGRIEAIHVNLKESDASEVRLDLKVKAMNVVEKGLSTLLSGADSQRKERLFGLTKRIFAENKRDIVQYAEA